jgi:CSLREA domain-containing protein
MSKLIRVFSVAIVALGSLVLAAPAQAATITVNTFADELTIDGDCSLREALVSANTDGADPNSDACAPGSGTDTIVLPAGTYARTEAGVLEVTSPLSIDPTGVVVIDGAESFPLFSVSATGSLTMADLTVRRGRSAGGGGLYNDGGTVTLERVTFEANISNDNDGAGIYNNGGTLTVRNSTFSGNRSVRNGGGLFNGGGTATLNNVTLAGNVADSDASGDGDGGGIFNDAGTTAASNTLIGDNTDGSTGGSPKAPDCAGTIQSGGYNLIEDVGGCTIAGVTTGNLINRNPQLFSLADNGGSTPTHALRKGSDAVEGGNPAAPGSSATACETTDQRGIPRPQGPRCDIGAFELEKPSEVLCLGRPVTITGTAGDDVITGTNKRDVIRALGGNDVIDALGGNDRICAGAGNDRVNGRSGKDVAAGGAGNDRMIGAGGDDDLRGQGGRDRLKGKGGDDLLRGGPEPDNLNGGAGTDTCRGGGGRDRIRRCEA